MVTGDQSDQEEEEEEEGENENPQEGVQEEELNPNELRMENLLKDVKGDTPKVKMEFPMYGGNLDSEEVLGWIDALDNYFEYEEVAEDQRVKFSKKKLKGHALTWWNYV